MYGSGNEKHRLSLHQLLTLTFISNSGTHVAINRSIDRCLTKMDVRLATISAVSHNGRTVENTRSLFPLSTADTDAFRELARPEDVGARRITLSVDQLTELGWLTDAIALTGRAGSYQSGRDLIFKGVRALIELSQVNLPLARLFEGHVNALRLMQVHADPGLVAVVLSAVRKGAMLGVWGADDGKPVPLDSASGSLSGRKRYASGLGVVTHAIVTAMPGEASQLCLVDVRDPAPSDAAAWRMSGMRATASGTYDVSAVPPGAVTPFGKPDCFATEPGLGGAYGELLQCSSAVYMACAKPFENIFAHWAGLRIRCRLPG